MPISQELNAVWAESVREACRTLCAKLGTENPRLEDLKLIALAPGEGDRPNFQFPRVWNLQDSAGYYQTGRASTGACPQSPASQTAA